MTDDSQEVIGDLPHVAKPSYLRGQLNADDFELVKRGSGVLRGRALCLSLEVKAELETESSPCKVVKIRHIHCHV